MTQFNQENINPTYSDYPEDNSDYQARLTQKVDKLGNFSLNMLRSLVLWRLIGYGFLVLFALDVVAIVVPPNFLNPQWEFQILGEIVERVAIPFIALLLIFFGGNYLRKGWEYLVLTSLSWLSLIVGVLFILAVPLGIINTIRIDTQATTRLTEQTNQRLEILKQVETKLKDVNSREEMQVLISQLSNNNAPTIENDQQLTEAKQRLGEFITSSRNQLSTQTDLANNQRRKSLIKQSVKWNLGALISGILFVMIWQMTKWARQKVK